MSIIKVICIAFGMVVAMSAQSVNDLGQLARIFQKSKIGKAEKYPRLTAIRIDRNNKIDLVRLVEDGNQFNVEYCALSNIDMPTDKILTGCKFRIISSFPADPKFVSTIMDEISKPPAVVTLDGSVYWVTVGGSFWSNTIKFTDGEWDPCLSTKRVVKLFCLNHAK